MNAMKELNAAELTQVEGGVGLLVVGAVVVLAGMAFGYGVMVGLSIGGATSK